MSVAMQREYGKGELVELLTGSKGDAGAAWLTAAMRAEVEVQPEDMPAVHQAVLSYKANRIRNYGENGSSTRYYAPAFDLIEKGFAEQNFERFKQGCEVLLDLIAAD